MKSLADAIVYGVTYINSREADDEGLDDDVAALESIAGILANATKKEIDALAAAAKRALVDEKSADFPNEEMIEVLSTWMEDLFGGDWVGNDRA
ncbi:MAG: hypothetical protein AAFV88_04200 [Planctomycetota bacterium]